ncbi:unnamed protein product [Pieris macdunnoughi]|uniref:Reverse transcriptase domain-containing protein n=1 Tax=Pieris macdunnoughi TaxID=345717 RepID=A0A821QV79_9NEOP|nr:unnamed protein product [Pieris macdunnoughi]
MVIISGTVPYQWCKSEIVLLYKKGDTRDISNYRPISLLSSIYKLFSSLLLSRISDKIDLMQPVEQAGFRSSFSTIDHIHTIEQLLEKFKEFNYPLYIGFVDYLKAFDSITHCSIWEPLTSCNMNYCYTKVIQNYKLLKQYKFNTI